MLCYEAAYNFVQNLRYKQLYLLNYNSISLYVHKSFSINGNRFFNDNECVASRISI